MECRAWQEERNQECLERYLLSRERIQEILQEETVGGRFRSYFRTVSSFMMQIGAVWDSLRDGSWDIRSAAEMRKINRELYEDVLAENYGTSYANPTYAAKQLGEYGQLLSALYTELRAAIPYVFEERLDYLTILQELFLEVYHCFEAEEKPELKALKHIFYWYASDYSDVFLADRIVEQLNPECSFALDIIMNSDFREERFLYRYGEYVTENELGTFWHLQSLPQETLQKMADVYTEGYRIGFVNTGKDLSKKSTVNIRYCLGFEPMIRLAVENFRKMGLIPTIYRAAVSVITKKEQFKIGYYGAIANKQYEYDHRCDVGLVLDKRFVERKLDVLKNTYEKNKELAAGFAGPACVEIFGENPFSPETRPEAVILTEAQDKLSLLYDSKSGQLTNQYIKGEERSYTIVAYPVPEIGPQYREIFDEVIQINTLDAGLYERVQQTLIDALDQGEYVHILGKGENQTDLRVHLHSLRNPEKETIFENCVADSFPASRSPSKA